MCYTDTNLMTSRGAALRYRILAQGMAQDMASVDKAQPFQPKYGEPHGGAGIYHKEMQEIYELMAGIEGMAVSSDGGLWSVSEAGTIKYSDWETYFPVVFRINLTDLSL